MRLHIDITTLKDRNIEPGDRITATVNDQNHVLSFRPGGHGSITLAMMFQGAVRHSLLIDDCHGLSLFISQG